jgi:isopropylmalate/homocitrate/citramalate synthase
MFGGLDAGVLGFAVGCAESAVAAGCDPFDAGAGGVGAGALHAVTSSAKINSKTDNGRIRHQSRTIAELSKVA